MSWPKSSSASCEAAPRTAHAERGSDHVADTPTNRVVLTAYPPEPTGDALYDAALASLTEYRLNEVGAPLPHWINSAPTLDEARVLTDSRFVTATVLGPIPDEFAQRGVLIDTESLRSA